MARNNLQVIGLNKTIKRLETYGKRVATETAEEINGTMLDVESNAKRRAPVDFGRLRSSIVTTKAKASDLVATTEVGVVYGPYVEFGTKSKVEIPFGLEEYASQFRTSTDGATGGITAQPFLFPAFNDEVPKLEPKLIKILQDA